jgi:hypothetical protein
MGMTSIAHHAPSRSLALHVPAYLGREVAIAAIAFALLFAGLEFGMALHGSRAPRTQSLVPTQTQTAPNPGVVKRH